MMHALDGVFDDLSDNDEPVSGLSLDKWELAALRRILRRAQKKCLTEIRKNNARGWQPELGRLDLSRTELGHVHAMLRRLGFDEDCVLPEGE